MPSVAGGSLRLRLRLPPGSHPPSTTTLERKPRKAKITRVSVATDTPVLPCLKRGAQPLPVQGQPREPWSGWPRAPKCPGQQKSEHLPFTYALSPNTHARQE